MRHFLAVFLVLTVAGCASGEAETPAQKLYAIQGEFNIAGQAALAYTSLPECTPQVVVRCYDPEVKDRIVSLARRTRDAIAKGWTVIDTPAAGGYVAIAGAALSELAAYLASKEIQ